LAVTMVTAPGRVGGIESVVASLSTGLAARDHAIRVVALLGTGENDRCDAFADFARNGVELMEIRLSGRQYREEIRRLVGVFRDAPPAVIHSHGYHADVVGWRSARVVGLPIVSTVHGFTGGNLKNRAYEWIDRKLLARFDAVVAVSQPLAQRLEGSGVNASRLHAVPNGLSQPAPMDRARARQALGIGEDQVVVGWVGRLTAERGPDVFVDAIARLSPTVTASVVGAGPLRQPVEARARQIGVASRIRWHGLVVGAGGLVSAFDVLVLSSRTEGTPIVLLEAMAAGVPVVATSVGGIPDVAPAGEVMLVPPDSPERLAHAITDCLADPGATAGRVARARERIRAAYAIEPWLDRYETVYRSLL